MSIWENNEVEVQSMDTAIKFLTTVFDKSVTDLASILTAQAEGDKETICKYLTTVRDFIDNLIKEL